MFNKNVFLFLLVFSSLAAVAQSSNRVYAPYSKGNLGFLKSDFYSKNFGMANTGIAQYHMNSVNLKNPALLAYNKFTILETNIAYRMDEFSSDTSLRRTNSGGINGIHLVLPFSYKWTSAISLTPISSTSYGAQTITPVNNSSDSIIQTDTSSGGIQQIKWSNGFSVYKGLNLGASLSYSFGNITKESRTEMQSLSETQVVNDASTSDYNGFDYELGASYHKEITLKKPDPNFVPEKDTLLIVKNGKKRKTIKVSDASSDVEILDTILRPGKNNANGSKLKIGLGATYAAPIKWSKKEVSATYNSFYSHLDTTTVNVTTPTKFGFGLSIGNSSRINNWSFALDYEIVNWQDLSIDGKNSELPTGTKLSLGLIFTPEIQSESFFRKISYSAGAYQHKTPYLHKEAQLDEVGMHFGLSFVDRAKRSNESYRWRDKSPKRINALSRFNVGVAVGTLGSNEPSAIQQAFIKLNVGISLNSEWFIRRKIN